MSTSFEFFPIPVKEIRPETSDASTLVFDIPAALKETFAYRAGQYLTLRFVLSGKEYRRAYSMCSSPVEENLAITVKRVKNGKISNLLNDKLKVGQTIDIMPPQGRFTPDLAANQRRTYYLFGAGSGITPLMSILKTILEEEPQSSVFLLYGNRSESSIIFREELAQFEKRYAAQFLVEHILSKPQGDKPKGLSGLFTKSTSTAWEGKKGRIDAKEVTQFLQDHPAHARESRYFICGPNSMMDTVTAALKEHSVEDAHIYTERFVNTSGEVAGKGVDGAQVTVHWQNQTYQVVVPAKKTILDVLINERINPPYSCTSGACSTCMAKVLKGSVTMDVCYALDEDEVSAGFVLACQARPQSEEIELTFDV